MVVCFYEFDSSDKIALIDDVESISYKHLNDRVKIFQEQFDGSLGMIVAKNDISTVACYVAALRSNCTVFLLSGNIAQKTLSDLIELYSPNWVYCENKLQRTKNDFCEIKKRSAPMVLISTSGSTGTKKFVKLTQTNLQKNAESIVNFLPIEKDDVATGFLPLSYSYGLSIINTHLLMNASVCITNRSIIDQDSWKLMRRASCNSFSGVPKMYEFMNKLRIELDGMKYGTCAGGALKSDLVRHHVRRPYSFWTMYGQTEATARMSIVPYDMLENKIGSAGIPIKDGKFEIASDGEILYSGPNVYAGYCTDRSSLENDEYIDVLRTGDIGNLDSDGFLWITGRKARFAKIAGHRISLDEIQNAIQKDIVCVSRTDEEITVFTKDELEINTLVADLSNLTSLPRKCFKIVRIDDFPLNESGKIDYVKLS